MGIYFIAEAGVNHNGDMVLAKKLVDIAKEAGADAVKFQTFIAEEVVSIHGKQAEYQKENTGKDESQLDMIRSFELSFADFQELKDYADKVGITFLSTPFDLKSADFLDGIGVSIFKVPSGEITNYPYLKKIASFRKPVIISTGMSDIEEIEGALKVLRENGATDITVLHCNSQYPTPLSDANVLAMLDIKEKFAVPVGYSDHTLTNDACIAAAALGATVLEKHFTADKSLPGPDQICSASPEELRALIESVRNVEILLGDGIKRVSESERDTKDIARRSIIARCDIKKGEVLSESNLCVKRPGNGISPTLWDAVLGTVAVRDFEADELIEI